MNLLVWGRKASESLYSALHVTIYWFRGEDIYLLSKYNDESAPQTSRIQRKRVSRRRNSTKACK